MKKLFTFLIAVLCYNTGKTQQILLFAETFETDTSGSSLMLNTGGPSNNYGNNQWIVNNDYNGLPLYPSTPPEDSAANGGIIFDAPYSHYLHIHNTARDVASDNWDTASASHNFCYISSPFCTAGLDSVIFTFFWLCEGDSNAYGQVYYSANSGPWIQTGRPKYNNQSEWIYETIQDTAFNNLQNLQFGFRWVNAVTSDSTDVSFGIDDIIAVGNYDSVFNPTTMSVAIVPPDTVCWGDPMLFNLNLSQALCDGEYEIEMSNASGNFDNYTDLGTYSDLPGGYTSYAYLQTQDVPSNIMGNCFQLRVVRLTPPIITSDTSACFSIIHCANTISNTFVPVLTDADTACILSALDVFFNSTGTYNTGNVYIAQLSDSTGSFTDSTVLGTFSNSSAYPSLPQGDIAGIIPAGVPPGCGYYVRVCSTSPPVIGQAVGPYCVKQCDVLTNNQSDIHLCIGSVSYPLCNTLNIEPHEWNNNARYDTCNKWEVQLLDMNTLSIINTGFFGVFYDSVGGNYQICAPSNADSLAFLPAPQWEYYLRIVSTCSDEPWNETGSIVRLVIGAPQTTPPVITVSDSIACNEQGSEISLSVSPFNYPANQYYWSSNLLNNGIPFIWDYNPLVITLAPTVPKGTYTFFVQEVNNGCYGPISAPATVGIRGVPVDTISGPSQVCLGDTVTFNVNYQEQTYYYWTASAGARILDPSNVQTRLIFDTVGAFSISCYSIDSCGEYTTTFPVNVVQSELQVAATSDTICKNQSDTIQITNSSIPVQFISSDSGTASQVGGMFNLLTRDNVIIDSFAVRFWESVNVAALVFGKNGSYQSFENMSSSWSQLASATFHATANQMTVIPAEMNISLSPGDTFGFYITSSNNVRIAFTEGSAALQGTVFDSDGIVDFIQGTSNQYPFGSYLGSYVMNVTVFYRISGGPDFVWNTGDSGSVIYPKPENPGNYTYSVAAQGIEGCATSASVAVYVENCVNDIRNVLTLDDDVSLLPNPTSGIVFLKSDADILDVAVYDVNGRKIYETTGAEKMIDISQFAAGMYLAKVTTGTGICEKKIILIK